MRNSEFCLPGSETPMMNFQFPQNPLFLCFSLLLTWPLSSPPSSTPIIYITWLPQESQKSPFLLLQGVRNTGQMLSKIRRLLSLFKKKKTKLFFISGHYFFSYFGRSNFPFFIYIMLLRLFVDHQPICCVFSLVTPYKFSSICKLKWLQLE